MCSVVGYVGKNQSKAFVLEGLTRLEYRGYDSAGFACISPESNRLACVKSQGQLQNLLAKCKQMPVDGHLGIGHTRWSTHGAATEANAHPHFDCQKSISVVHNGIIENHHELREALKKAGHIFVSDTDTEVIAHSLEAVLPIHKRIKPAMVELVNKLEGAYAFVAIMQSFPDQMIAVRKRSPLCIGIGRDELFVASDPLAFAGRTKKVIYVPDEAFVIMKAAPRHVSDSQKSPLELALSSSETANLELYSFSGTLLKPDIQELDVDWTDTEKRGHEHFMLKEIYEQKGAIASTVKYYQQLGNNLYKQMELSKEQLKDLKSIKMVGCGTSWHAARIAQFFFEEIAKVPTSIHLASEFRYMPFFNYENSLYIAISQSGETADTLEVVRMINDKECTTVALTNVPSSTMVREANGFLLTHAGPEIAVASTKAFSTQVTVLFWLAHRIALDKGLITMRQLQVAEEDLLIAAEVLENTIDTYRKEISATLAKKYAQFNRAIFLGRHISYPFALEAALKLKEISYIFAQGYPAGELKHGPIALVDSLTPVFLFSSLDPMIYQKLVANAQEVKARKGHIIAFAFEGQKELISLADCVFMIPKVHPLLGPLAMTGLMQFLSYAIAKELGCAIDKPRNLAKSVTVE